MQRRAFQAMPVHPFYVRTSWNIQGSFRFDAAFASGLLNHKRRRSHMAHVERIRASDGEGRPTIVAVDFLSHTSDRRRPDLFFHDPARLLHIGLAFTKRAQLDHSYMPYEFMLKLWFPDSAPVDFPVFP